MEQKGCHAVWLPQTKIGCDEIKEVKGFMQMTVIRMLLVCGYVCSKKDLLVWAKQEPQGQDKRYFLQLGIQQASSFGRWIQKSHQLFNVATFAHPLCSQMTIWWSLHVSVVLVCLKQNSNIWRIKARKSYLNWWLALAWSSLRQDLAIEQPWTLTSKTEPLLIIPSLIMNQGTFSVGGYDWKSIELCYSCKEYRKKFTKSTHKGSTCWPFLIFIYSFSWTLSLIWHNHGEQKFQEEVQGGLFVFGLQLCSAPLTCMLKDKVFEIYDRMFSQA